MFKKTKARIKDVIYECLKNAVLKLVNANKYEIQKTITKAVSESLFGPINLQVISKTQSEEPLNVNINYSELSGGGNPLISIEGIRDKCSWVNGSESKNLPFPEKLYACWDAHHYTAAFFSHKDEMDFIFTTWEGKIVKAIEWAEMPAREVEE